MTYEMMIKMCFLTIWNHKDLSVDKSWDLQYNHEGYMALALAQYEDLI
jgi:hypothetical protein